MDIHRYEGPGDILIFMSGKDEIETVVSLVNESAERYIFLLIHFQSLITFLLLSL